MKRLAPTVATINLLVLIGLVGFAVLATPGVSAQSRPAAPPQTPTNDIGQALEIAPPVIPLTANPGQLVKSEISLRNISSGNLLVKGQVNDFIAAGEDGTPKILFEEDTSENPHSIKSWISPFQSMIIAPRQIKKLPVTIQVPANASPGGYYGVVRFTATPPELKDTGVSLSASLGSLVLLRVNGKVAEKMSIAEFAATKDGRGGTLFEAAPLDFTIRLKNEGNIHEQPAGQAEITDMFGKKLATLSINQPPRNVLPGSIRKFNHPLDKSVIGDKMLFGRYTANLKVSYGTNKETVSSSLTFWVIPYKLIIGIILAILVGFFTFRILITRYNRSIIQKAQGGSGKSKKKSRK